MAATAVRRVAVAVDSASEQHRVHVLGFPVDLIDAGEVRAWLRSALASEAIACRHLVTLNPEYVMAARRDPEFAAAIHHAELVVADGVGVTLAARALDHARIERVTGVDIVEWLAAGNADAGTPLFLLGAAPGVAERAAAELGARFAGAKIAGSWGGGSAAPVHDAESRRRIAESGARAVAVAYGAPGQVTWIARNQRALAEAGVRVAIGVGGSLDYLSGAASRPPVIVRRLGLEWAFRLVREPWRWRRQTVLPKFAALVFWAKLARVRAHR